MIQKLALAVGAALFGFTTVAHAQAPKPAPGPALKIGCPAAGTMVERVEGNVPFSTTYRGTDPADPAVCISETNGRTQRILFGVYLLDGRTGRLDARSRIDQLFTGKVRETSFTSSLPAANQGISLFLDRWVRLDDETTVIAGRTVNAVVFQRTVNGQSGNNFSARFTYFYDPATSVWVKRNERVWRGNPEPMIVTKITAP